MRIFWGLCKDRFVWDADTLKLKNTLEMPEEIQEGWGMTKRTEEDENGNKVTRLYVTDGSSNIHVVDPNGFKVLKSIKVKTNKEYC
jgi:glutamine cyclotransferase